MSQSADKLKNVHNFKNEVVCLTKLLCSTSGYIALLIPHLMSSVPSVWSHWLRQSVGFQYNLAVFSPVCPSSCFQSSLSMWMFSPQLVNLAVFSPVCPSSCFQPSLSIWLFSAQFVNLTVLSPVCPSSCFQPSLSIWLFSAQFVNLTVSPPFVNLTVFSPVGQSVCFLPQFVNLSVFSSVCQSDCFLPVCQYSVFSPACQFDCFLTNLSIWLFSPQFVNLNISYLSSRKHNWNKWVFFTAPTKTWRSRHISTSSCKR